MKIINPTDYRQRIVIAKALAHCSRMMILDVLKEGEMCVSELTKLIGSDQSTVSKHISILKNAGLVNSRKDGLNVFYQLSCPCIQNFFDCLEQVLQTNYKINKNYCIIHGCIAI